MSKPIQLGKKWDDMIKVMGPDDIKDEVHYPTLHLDGDPRLGEMPDTGEMTIKYRIRHKTHEEHKEKDGKKHSCSVTLDILSVDPPAAKSKKKNGDSDGGARKAFSDYWKDK